MTISNALLPINKFNFEEIYTRQMVYVDKTELIYQMVSIPNYYFFSRPRRFGKSLLVSTLKHLYLGHQQYFDNLWLGQHTNWEWREWPILLMDFNSISCSNPEALLRGLSASLISNAQKYDIDLKQIDIKEQFKEFIITVSKKTKSKIVILIDEYDKPIIDHIPDDIDIAKANRKIMKEFFGVLKDIEAGTLVELLFITGVSKFSQVSIFSELNNLNDLTMNTQFATLLGYTSDELRHYFHPWVQKWAEDKDLDELMIYKALKNHYDGFRFSSSNKKVYNPISILNALYKQEYQNFWFGTATPTFLINLLVNQHFSLPKIETITLNEDDFNSFEPDNLNPASLLFQTGYITIDDVQFIDNSNKYKFDFPNIEVRQSFLRLLMIKYGRLSASDNLSGHFRINQDFTNKRFALGIKRIQDILTIVPEFDNQNHDWFHQFFYMLIRSACPFTRTINIDHKMVIMIENETSIIFTAFSCSHSTTELIKCLKQDNEILSFKQFDKEIILIGISFNIKKRVISEWTYEGFSITSDEVPIKPNESSDAKKSSSKIYISSTYEDLETHRKAVYDTLRQWQIDVIAMEDYIASDKRPLDKCLEDVSQCDVYIGLFAWRYGYIPQGQNKSITHLEYERAQATQKPCFIFMLHEDAMWKRKFMDTDLSKVEQFRKKLQKDHTVAFFSSVDELKALISASLTNPLHINR